MFLLDTNTCIRILNGSSQAVLERLKARRAHQIALCSVVKAELYFGARKSARPGENMRALERFFGPYASLAFDDACALRYGDIRYDLERRGTPIGRNDLMIATIAVVHGRILVTHNLGEFSRVVGLKLEDWEA